MPKRARPRSESREPLIEKAAARTQRGAKSVELSASGIVGRRLQLIPHAVDSRLVFRFEFGPAILSQVLEQIEQLDPVPLVEAANTAEYPGFYQLLHNGESRYIGRALRPVQVRLKEHVKKLRSRIPLEEVTCRYLYVEDLSLVGLSEDTLIAYFYPRGCCSCR